MSLFDRLFDYTRDVVGLSKEVQDLGKRIERIEVEQREADRRLVRIETILELARARATDRLPRQD